MTLHVGVSVAIGSANRAAETCAVCSKPIHQAKVRGRVVWQHTGVFTSLTIPHDARPRLIP